MSSFTNYPILVAESMNPFDVSIAFKCEKCGRVSKTLNHICCEGEMEIIIHESLFQKMKRFFKTIKKIKVMEV